MIIKFRSICRGLLVVLDNWSKAFKNKCKWVHSGCKILLRQGQQFSQKKFLSLTGLEIASFMELIFMTGSHIVNIMEFIFATDRFQRLKMEKIDNITHTKIATLFIGTKFYQTNYYLEGVASTSFFILHIYETCLYN